MSLFQSKYHFSIRFTLNIPIVRKPARCSAVSLPCVIDTVNLSPAFSPAHGVASAQAQPQGVGQEHGPAHRGRPAGGPAQDGRHHEGVAAQDRVALEQDRQGRVQQRGGDTRVLVFRLRDNVSQALTEMRRKPRLQKYSLFCPRTRTILA